MNEKIKNYLSIVIMITLLVGVYSVFSLTRSYSQSIEPSSFRSFSVSDRGEVVAVPDIAQFTFSVIIEGDTDIAKIQAENTKKVNKAIDFVKDNGVDKKDIKTQSYNLSPRYQYFNCSRFSSGGEPCPPREIIGYTVSQVVSVKIRDFGKIGKILSGVISNGANSVSGLSFTIDDPSKVESAARAEAITKAKVKAKEIAKAGGFRVGRLLSIREGGGYTPAPYKIERAIAFGSVADVAAAPSIEPGSQDVAVSVTLTYEIR